MESRYRNNKDETLHVYDSSGNIITSFGGKGAEVRFNSKGIPENTILRIIIRVLSAQAE